MEGNQSQFTAGAATVGGRRHKKTKKHGMSVKALKRTLKKNGLKTTGRKSTLVKRAKKAHLMGGNMDEEMTA